MHWKYVAIVFAIAPFALLWLAFAVVETRRVVVAVRGGR